MKRNQEREIGSVLKTSRTLEINLLAFIFIGTDNYRRYRVSRLLKHEIVFLQPRFQWPSFGQGVVISLIFVV